MKKRLIQIAATCLLAAPLLAIPCIDDEGVAYRPTGTHIRYEYAGANTMVLVSLTCGGPQQEWYVGFFVGHGDPTLREWADIQNTASLLLP